MLPPSITHGLLSLASLSQEGKLEHIFTFSFKVDGEGNIADYDVKAGLIRHVTRVDYDSVDELLRTGSIQLSRPFEAPRTLQLAVYLYWRQMI